MEREREEMVDAKRREDWARASGGGAQNGRVDSMIEMMMGSSRLAAGLPIVYPSSANRLFNNTRILLSRSNSLFNISFRNITTILWPIS